MSGMYVSLNVHWYYLSVRAHACLVPNLMELE